MKKYTLDTNIMSYILKGNKEIFGKIQKEINNGNIIIVNLVTYYEICRGLLASNNIKKLNTFKRLCDTFGLMRITEKTFYRSAEIYAYLKKDGNLIEDADIFIGATCLEENLILITNNEKHFKRIKNLKFENWFSEK